jgi:hypothetical protein
VTSLATPTRGALNARQAVERLREVVHSGDFTTLLAVDRQSGELIRPEARALFSALPAVTPSTSPEELVDHGLLPSLPPNLRKAFDAPRYRAGREIFVRTSVTHQAPDRYRAVGAFDASAPQAFTHRGILRAQAADRFVVDLDGAPKALELAKADVYAWNEPTTIGQSVSFSGVQIDYNDALLKAHVAAGFLDIATELAALDFAAADTVVLEQQVRLLHRVARRGAPCTHDLRRAW